MKRRWFLCSVSLPLMALLLIGCSETNEELAVLPASPAEEQPAPSSEPTESDLEPAPSPEPTESDLEPAPEPEVQPPVSRGEEPAPEFSSQGIPWDEAKDHIGEKAIVCGRVVSTKYEREVSGKPTFLYLGKPDGFVVVIWDKYRSRFIEPPERYYVGKNICVGGEITEDKGIPQIEVQTPSQIR